MSDTPLVSLEKKKCRCGELAKIFFISSLPLEPGWFAVNAFLHRDEEKQFPILPHPFSQSELRLQTFFSICNECGSVSHWIFSKSEVEFLYTPEAENMGYKLSDLTQTEWIEASYGNSSDGPVARKIVEIARTNKDPGEK